MNLALVHDWITLIGGGERALKVFRELWPQAPLYTLVCDQTSARQLGFGPEQVRTSFLQRLPRATRWYRRYLPLYPLAVESFDLSQHEVILSSSHAAAKGVVVRADQLHICYCHTPMRYAWDLAHQYLRENRLHVGPRFLLAHLLLHYLRLWDCLTAPRVDYFLANSTCTARRIWRAYRREATVVYGPVNTERFRPSGPKEEYFIFVSRLVPYKRADLVIATFNRLGLPLVVVGDGPQMPQCRKMAGPGVRLVGYQDDEEVARLMARARAVVFAAEEDFGLVPVEAQAAGTPVIAYGRGGVEDTVVPATGDNWDSATGVFFHEQTPEALAEAVGRFIKWEDKFRPDVLRANAERFSREKFKLRVKAFVEEKWEEFRNRRRWG